MGSLVNALISGEIIPKMALVHQKFDDREVTNVVSATMSELERPELCNTVFSGMSIAVTAGSRGITNINLITKSVVDFLKSRGAYPFIIPAMGSHGGAIEQGQVDILTDYGITEKSMGVPIRASMEVTQIATLPDGTPVYIDSYAAQADGIVVINRIKPHTGFRGKLESGLMKMLVVGLGKQIGAEAVHSCGITNMSTRIEEIANAILANAKILFGIATVENAFEHTYGIYGMAKDEISQREPALLEIAKSLMPYIMFEKLDLLIVDRIGKNISGSGMDPNITHSFLAESGISREHRAKRIAVLDLTQETHGSAVGIGVADTTTRRLYDAMDFETTYPNCLTTSVTESSRIPMVFDNQELSIKGAIKTLQNVDKNKLRIVRIQDTLHLSELQISECLLAEAQSNPNISIEKDAEALIFDSYGNLF